MDKVVISLKHIDALHNAIECNIGDIVEFQSSVEAVNGVYDVVADEGRKGDPCKQCHFQDAAFNGYCSAIACRLYHFVKCV